MNGVRSGAIRKMDPMGKVIYDDMEHEIKISVKIPSL